MKEINKKIKHYAEKKKRLMFLLQFLSMCSYINPLFSIELDRDSGEKSTRIRHKSFQEMDITSIRLYQDIRPHILDECEKKKLHLKVRFKRAIGLFCKTFTFDGFF